MSSRDNQAFSAREFRDALSCFGTGVTIVTASDQVGRPVGMTASSFNSVSMDPPLVLWSVTKTALSAEVFRTAKHFAIHVLARDQAELCNTFARSGADKFGRTVFTTDENAVPILEGAVARFDCEAWAVYEGGDHWIIVGEVKAIDRDNKESLLFVSGAYALAAPFPRTSSEADKCVGQSSLVDDMLHYNLSQAYHRMIVQFHDIVRDSGLTVAEWRISSTLYGQSRFALSDLAARTFLDPAALQDILEGMAENGLCTISEIDDTFYATGTAKGHDRVSHLIALAKKHEKEALGRLDDKQASLLKASLRALSIGA